MPNYKVMYFDGRGRGEIVRLVLSAAGVQFEDVRVSKDDWPKLKPNAPFGQMPYLEGDGVKLGQSKAIARYVARKHGLAGKNDLDQACADMIYDCIEDTIQPMFKFFFEKNEDVKKELTKKFLEEQLPTSLTALESLLKENKGGDGFFVGDALTWADIGLVGLKDWLSIIGAHTQIANYPKLKALLEKVEKTPKIAEWLAKRPNSEW